MVSGEQSDASSLSSGSPQEIDKRRETGDNGGRNKGRGMTSAIEKLDRFLTCRESGEQFPSDSEESSEMASGGKGEVDYRLGDLLKSGDGVDRGKTRVVLRGGPPPDSPNERFFRAEPVRLDASSFKSRQMKPQQQRSTSPPVPLGGFKGLTATRDNQDGSPGIGGAGTDEQRRKRRPRLDAALRVCKEFLTDVMSKKHKDWSWPLIKPDKHGDRRNVFQNPVYLHDIKMKLDNREYESIDGFVTDIKTLVSNFCAVYGPDDQFHKSARNLQRLFDQKVRQINENPATNVRVRTPPRVTKTFAQVYGVDESSSALRNSSIVTKLYKLGGNVPLDEMTKEILLSRFGRVSEGTVNAGNFPSHSGGSMVVNDRNIVHLNPLVLPPVSVMATPPGNYGPRRSTTPVGSVPTPMVSSSSSTATVEGNGGSGMLMRAICGSRDTSLSLSESWSECGREGSVGPKPVKRRNEGSGGGQGKKPRADRGSEERTGPNSTVDLSAVKTEVCEEPEMGPPKRKLVSKWLMDGITAFAGEDGMLKELRDAVGKTHELEFNSELLENLDESEFCNVGMRLCRKLIGEHGMNPHNACKCSYKCRIAVDAISESQSQLSTLLADLSSARAQAHENLQRVNRMQEQAFEILNKLLEKKHSILTHINDHF